MIKLNQLIQNELKILGVKYNVYHPHNWALGTGIEFKGDLDFLDSDALCIVHGDVVDDSEQEFGILSGCLLYTSPSPRDKRQYRMPSSA